MEITRGLSWVILYSTILVVLKSSIGLVDILNFFICSWFVDQLMPMNQSLDEGDPHERLVQHGVGGDYTYLSWE